MNEALSCDQLRGGVLGWNGNLPNFSPQFLLGPGGAAVALFATLVQFCKVLDMHKYWCLKGTPHALQVSLHRVEECELHRS